MGQLYAKRTSESDSSNTLSFRDVELCNGLIGRKGSSVNADTLGTERSAPEGTGNDDAQTKGFQSAGAVRSKAF